MATATKAELEQQLAELQAALASSQARITDLEAQLEAAAPGRRDQLEQVLWLQKKAPTEIRYTQDGSPVIRIGGQYAAVNRETGRRLYGPMKFFTAIGENAKALLEIFETDTRLVRIGAYERPQIPAEDGTRRSEWVIASVSAIPAVQSQAPVAAGYGEPTEEEAPF